VTPETLTIDLRFKGVGRINKKSGTTDPVVVLKIKRKFRELYEDGRLDILRAVRDGHVSCLQVYDACRRRRLHELPIGETMPELATAMKAWIEGATKEYSTNHLGNLETARRLFEAKFPKARVADLPHVLEELRKTYGSKHPRSFNLARSAAQAFVRATLKRSHPLYIEVAAVETRIVKKRPPGKALSIDEVRERFPHPETDKVDAIAWSMVTTGMNPKEYWARWQTLSDRVHVNGTKRGGRERDIPLVRVPAVPRLSRDRWQRVFRERIAGAFTPYQLRRTYSQWMEAAHIPRARRRLYLGHGAKDVTDLYEAHEVTAFLAEDATKLREFLGLPDPTPTRLEVAS
jgi:integrase